MKAIIEINDKDGCISCPFCHYKDEELLVNVDAGFYCRKTKNKLITTFYNTPDGNGIIIPDWCELNFIKND